MGLEKEEERGRARIDRCRLRRIRVFSSLGLSLGGYFYMFSVRAVCERGECYNVE